MEWEEKKNNIRFIQIVEYFRFAAQNNTEHIPGGQKNLFHHRADTHTFIQTGCIKLDFPLPRSILSGWRADRKSLVLQWAAPGHCTHARSTLHASIYVRTTRVPFSLSPQSDNTGQQYQHNLTRRVLDFLPLDRRHQRALNRALTFKNDFPARDCCCHMGGAKGARPAVYKTAFLATLTVLFVLSVVVLFPSFCQEQRPPACGFGARQTASCCKFLPRWVMQPRSACVQSALPVRFTKRRVVVIRWYQLSPLASLLLLQSRTLSEFICTFRQAALSRPEICL